MDQNQEREVILREATKDMILDVSVDFSIIVGHTMGYSNEKLVMLCKEAVLLAGSRIVKKYEATRGIEFTTGELENVQVRQNDFMRAIRRFDKFGSRLPL